MQIKVKIPKDEKSKWKLGIGSRPRSMARADTLLNRLERVLSSRLILKEKIAIVIKEWNGTVWEKINETLRSKDKNYLLYTTSCFLEDFLSKESLKRIEKRYHSAT